MKTKYVLKRDVPLCIDVTCHKCKRRLALSNAIERDGRYYCGRCLSRVESGKDIEWQGDEKTNR